MKKKVAIQGLKGSFHHEASRHYFGVDADVIECESFRQVTEGVKSGLVDYGLMAIENSLAGSIVPNYLLIRDPDITICGELTMRVKMNLMVMKGGTFGDISEVRSHQMAIRQCTAFLQMHSGLKVVETFDTAGSAADIRENELQGIAAIASELAAETYGLSIIAKGIEDNQRSYTRFLVLTKREVVLEHANKASLYLETFHETGALANVLTTISELGINISKLQSHPVAESKGRYGFYIDLEFGHIDQFAKLQEAIKPKTSLFHCLGTYKKGITYE